VISVGGDRAPDEWRRKLCALRPGSCLLVVPRGAAAGETEREVVKEDVNHGVVKT